MFVVGVYIPPSTNAKANDALCELYGAISELQNTHPDGYSDHISVMLIPAYRPLIRRDRLVLKQIRTWPAGTISALQDCFEQTDWFIFREAETTSNSINLVDYTASLTSYINKCNDDITDSKTITTHSNQKPWMTAVVCALLKSRDSAFRTGDKAALR